jgi:hypothetical protein
MSAHELHVNNLIVEVDVYDQSVVVASDIEHNTVIEPPRVFRRLFCLSQAVRVDSVIF